MKIIPGSSSKSGRTNSFLSSKSSVKIRPEKSSFLDMIEETPEDSLLEVLFEAPDDILSNISILAEELDKIGQELLERPLPENFTKYKKHIRLLLKGAGRNIKIQEVTSRVGFTGTKLFRTAQAIDTALAELADKILHDEKNRAEILKLTDHLKGLILDIIA